MKLEQPDKTVLVIDDDRDTRVAASEMLTEAGYRPVTARNGLEALQLLRMGERPLAMIIDMYMPLMDGESFCDSCDADPRFASIPRIIVSVNKTTGQHLRRWRAVAFLDKPIDPERLLESLATVAVRQAADAIG